MPFVLVVLHECGANGTPHLHATYTGYGTWCWPCRLAALILAARFADAFTHDPVCPDCGVGPRCRCRRVRPAASIRVPGQREALYDESRGRYVEYEPEPAGSVYEP